MHINDILQPDKTRISFEFFPPRDKVSQGKLHQAISELASLKPAYVSVTYGAGGTTRELTHDLVLRIAQENHFTVVPHLTCVGHKREDVATLVARYASEGIHNILALRGDAPRDQHDYDHLKDDLPYAVNLVELLREVETPSDTRGFGIGVAGFPHGHRETGR